MANKGKPLGSMIINLDMDSSNFQRSLDGIQRDMKQANSAMKSQMAVLNSTGDSYGALGAKIKGMGQMMKVSQREVAELTKRHKEAIDTYGKGSKEAQNYANKINAAIQKQAAWASAIDKSKKDMIGMSNATAKYQEELRKLEASNKEIYNTVKATGRTYDIQKTKLKNLNVEVAKHKELVDEQRRILKETTTAYGAQHEATIKAKNDLDAMTAAQQKAIDKQKALNTTINGMTDAQAKTANTIGAWSQGFKDAGNNMHAAGKRISIAGGNMASGAMVGAAGVTLGFTKMMNSAIDFEQTLVDVESLMTAEEWSKNGEAMKSLIVSLGESTSFTATEVGNATQELVKAGLDMDQILNGGLKAALDLSVAGNLDLTKSAELMSVSLNAFKDDAMSAGKAADIMTGSAIRSATTVEEMGYAMSQVSAVAASAGFHFDEVSTALGIFASNGLKGSDAGTSLKTMIARLSPATKDARVAMEDLGLATYNTQMGYDFLVKKGFKPASNSIEDVEKGFASLAREQVGAEASTSEMETRMGELTRASGFLSSAFYDSKGNIKDMASVFETLNKSVDGLSPQQVNDMFNVIFGSDAKRSALIAAKTTREEFDKLGKSIDEVSAAAVSAKKMDTLKGHLEELRGATETLITTFGTYLIPTIEKVVEGMKWLVETFSGFSDTTKKAIGALIGIPAIMLPIVFILGLMAKGFGTLTSAVGFGVKGMGAFLSLFNKADRDLKRNERQLLRQGNATKSLGSSVQLLGSRIGAMSSTLRGSEVAWNRQFEVMRQAEIQARRTGSALATSFTMNNTGLSAPAQLSPVAQGAINAMNGKSKKNSKYVVNRNGAASHQQLQFADSAEPKKSKFKVPKGAKVGGAVTGLALGAYGLATAENGTEAAKSIGNTIGVVAGGALGAAVGSIAGPIGSTIGGTVGSMVGGTLAEKVTEGFKEGNGLFEPSAEKMERAADKMLKDKEEKEKKESKKRIEKDEKKKYSISTKGFDSKEQALEVDSVMNRYYASVDSMERVYSSSIKLSSKQGKAYRDEQQKMSEATQELIQKENETNLSALKKIYDDSIAKGIMTEEDKAKAVKAEEEAQTKRLERVIKNNERIAEINNLAAKEKRALTIEEYKELDSLRNANSLAELDTLNLSNEQYQLVMTERAKFEESISEEDMKRTRERIAKKDKAEREAAKKTMDDEIARIKSIEGITEADRDIMISQTKADYQERLQLLDLQHRKELLALGAHSNDKIKLSKAEQEAFLENEVAGREKILSAMKMYDDKEANEEIIQKLMLTDLSRSEAEEKLAEYSNMRRELAAEARASNDEEFIEAQTQKLMLTGLSRDQATIMIKHGSRSNSELADIYASTTDKLEKEMIKRVIIANAKSKEEADMLILHSKKGKKGVVKWVREAKDETERESRLKMIQNSDLAKEEKDEIIKAANKGKRGSVKAVKSALSESQTALSEGQSSFYDKALALFNNMPKAAEKSANATGSVVGQVEGWMGVNPPKRQVDFKFPIGAYAKGTDYHPGGLALVNDAKGKDYKELITTPDGGAFVPSKRNTVMNLPQGSQVLPGNLTKALFGDDMPKYAKGTGFISSIGAKLAKWKDSFSEFMANPLKTIKAMVSKVLPQNSPKGTAPGNIEQGFIRNAPNWINKYFEGLQSSIGGAPGSTSITNGYGVYDYLYNIAKRVMAMPQGRGLRITSGHRPGDTYDHGRHNAVDLSGFGSNGGYKNIAQLVSKMPGVSYTIGDNTVFGRKYGNGGKPGWATGHMNHVHISGVGGKGFGDFNGSRVDRWRSIITRSLKANGLPTNDAYVSAWLRQVKTESGGNPNVIGGTDGFNDGRATGLLQVKPTTFAAYKHKGHGNIMNPYDNALAAIAYAKKRYGAKGMLNRIGKGIGYKNGGIVSNHQIAEIAEGGKAEAVIPLTQAKRTNAFRIMKRTQDIIGKPEKESNNINNSTEFKALESKFNTMIELMAQLVNKDNSIYIDGKEIYSTNKIYQNKNSRKVNFARGQ